MLARSPIPGAVSAVDAVAALVRDDVLGGRLAPGTHLRDADLVARYGVARHTVRSAVQGLVRGGVLVHAPNRGAFVPVPDERSGDDLYRFRRILELGALREARAAGASLAGARETLARLQAMPDDVPWQEVALVHADLHEAIVAAAGNARLSAAYAAVRSEVQFFLATLRPVYTVRSMADTHARLVTALEGADDEAAAAALERDLAEGRAALAAALRGGR